MLLPLGQFPKTDHYSIPFALFSASKVLVELYARFLVTAGHCAFGWPDFFTVSLRAMTLLACFYSLIVVRLSGKS